MYMVKITSANPDIQYLERIWARPAFTSNSGIGSLESLHQAGDAVVAIAGLFDDQLISIGSGVMIGPGIALTATHVLDEFPKDGSGPVLISFLPDGAARAWLPSAVVTCSGQSQHGLLEEKKFKSDLSVVSCTLNSASLPKQPFSLAPLELCLPLPGERLWAVGFRDSPVDGEAAATPLVSSGLVSNCYPHGRGERMASSCIEIDMETLGGMSGGPVMNADGRVIGIVSSSFEGGPTYATLVWDAMRLSIEGLPPEVWGGDQAGLNEGVEKGLIRIKGKYTCDARRNLTLTLSDAEMAILKATQPTSRHA